MYHVVRVKQGKLFLIQLRFSDRGVFISPVRSHSTGRRYCFEVTVFQFLPVARHESFLYHFHQAFHDN